MGMTNALIYLALAAAFASGVVVGKYALRRD